MAMSKALRSTRTISSFFQAAINLSRSLTTKQNISYEEPHKPIVCQLALAVKQNPVRTLVHGLWMGFSDNQGLVSLHNRNPSSDDFIRGRADLNLLTAAEKAELKTIWPAKRGRSKDFWSYEYGKHSLTAFGIYKPRYFPDALELARPFMAGGSKDLAAFIIENFEVGKKYPIAQVEGAIGGLITADAALYLKPTGPAGPAERDYYLSGINLAYLEDRRANKNLVLMNHPPMAFVAESSDWTQKICQFLQFAFLQMYGFRRCTSCSKQVWSGY